MRARPREINIFNMSLLDILCGALGAFCFMMLVALPYYKGPGGAKQNEQDILVIIQEIEILRQQISDPTKAEELKKLIERLKAQIQQLEGERNLLANENAKLKMDVETANKAVVLLNDQLDEAETENENLEQENLEQKAALAAKKPFAVMATTSDFQQPVDLYLERTSFIVMGAPFERFNPAEGVHRSPEADDVNAWAPERGVTFWVNANARPGSGYRVFLKHLNVGQPRPSRDSTVKLTFFGNFAERPPTPSFTLSGVRPWLLAGLLNIDSAGEISFKEATEQERDEAWRRITQSEPPPKPTPGATAAPAGTPTQEDRERWRRQSDEERRKYEELRRQKQQQGGTQSPAAGASPDRGSDAAARALRERERREREAQPTASPQP
ncbi:MAG: hypothetical protein ABR589_11375 [Chthoniobacterales bacterium]